ncbi:hypothetical protein AL522_20725 [Pantoea vagans]|nr:hypothetical protein AL522_20725 [Pantoea vagans]
MGFARENRVGEGIVGWGNGFAILSASEGLDDTLAPVESAEVVEQCDTNWQPGSAVETAMFAALQKNAQ